MPINDLDIKESPQWKKKRRNLSLRAVYSQCSVTTYLSHKYKKTDQINNIFQFLEREGINKKTLNQDIVNKMHFSYSVRQRSY